MSMLLTEKQLEVMEATGNVLVTGGPGSGKTTVSILKAARLAKEWLRPGERILFLSFARATVSRVVQAIEHEHGMQPAQKSCIDVDTYHAFFWRIIRTHGYLVGLPRRLTVLTASAEAIALSETRSRFPSRNLTPEQKAAKAAAEEGERLRLAVAEGRVCFDLYAPYAGDILHGSERIRRLMRAMYPVIVLDEFQDTNGPQWRVVQALGAFCRLVALADPEQRIYGWLGADPARLDHFRESFEPVEFDLSNKNHRSSGTEIAMFGNDLLKGRFRQSAYKGVAIEFFNSLPAPAMTKLVTTTYAARKRLMQAGVAPWSIAILVPTKKMTRLVSDALRQPPANMPEVFHSAMVESEALELGAEVVAHLLQPDVDGCHFAQLVELACNYFHGKGGDLPTQGALKEAASIRQGYQELRSCQKDGKEIRKGSKVGKFLDVYERTRALVLSGDPVKDWIAIIVVLEQGACSRLTEIARVVRNGAVVERGGNLRQELSQDWRENGRYPNALAITRSSFVQAHFSTNARPEVGVVVMNMHKAKGKQFDEVIIFEGWPIKRKKQLLYNADRIVRLNSRANVNEQARQTLRVSVTRAKRRTTILTPIDDPCVLLPAAEMG